MPSSGSGHECRSSFPAFETLHAHQPLTNLLFSLEQSDRDKLHSAAQKFSTYASIGSALGLGLGIFLAYRLRSLRSRTFAAFRASEKPTHVQFADGRLEAIPDVTPLMRPTRLGDIATYTFFAAGGVFVFGELGMVAGAWSARRQVMGDPESRKRIETAFKRFRAEVLRKEAEDLEAEAGTGGIFGGLKRSVPSL